MSFDYDGKIHPFEGSPGVLSEINAIDTIMRYVIDELRFPQQRIIIYAWSIGGYAACWAATHYGNLHGLVLDAVFDDVLPLAQRQMPAMGSNLVEKTIRRYFDLNNIPLLESYNGPFYLVRRTQDEVMNLLLNQPETNRANAILLHILPYRYPFIYTIGDETVELLQRYLHCDDEQRQQIVDLYSSDDLRIETDMYRMEHPAVDYPCRFGWYFRHST